MLHDKALVIALIKRSDRTRYSSLLDSLENQFALSINQYPNNMVSTLTFLDCYVKPSTHHRHLPDNDNADNIVTTFVQDGDGGDTPGTGGITHDGVTCYGCQATGHYRDKYPSSSDTSSPHIQLLQINEDSGPHTGLNDDDGSGVSATSFVHIADEGIETVESNDGTTESDNVFVDFGFAKIPRRTISPSFILLDSESTVFPFCNKNLLTNIRPRPEGCSVEVHTNGGTQNSSLIGDTAHFDTIWFNDQLITNILSLTWVTKRYRVTRTHIFQRRCTYIFLQAP